MIKIKKAIVISIATVMLTSPFLVSAAPLVPCGCLARDANGNCTNEVPCTVCHFFVLISKILDFLVEKIALPIAVVILIYGGIMMLTSGGSEDKLKKGKNALWMAVWGMLITFAAWLIVDTIIKWLVDPNFQWQFGPWNEIPPC